MKKALLTTTALVALNSAAFASSIDTPVNSASSTHHTHSAATIVWTGDANIKYNVPLVKTTNGVKNKADRRNAIFTIFVNSYRRSRKVGT